MLKFRSMCVDAEERLAELQELNEKSGPVFKIADDPRITRVGKWIRKLSLDELPQFFNVLEWRWAYGNEWKAANALKRIREMRDFARTELRNANKEGWPIHLRASLLLARSTSSLSLATGYYINQLYIRLFPDKAGSRR